MLVGTHMLMCTVHNFQQWAIYLERWPICQIFTVMFSVQSVQFWAGIINQRRWLKVELSLAEKPLILMGKALAVWQFRSLCSACNTIVLMKDSATVLQGTRPVHVYVSEDVCLSEDALSSSLITLFVLFVYAFFTVASGKPKAVPYWKQNIAECLYVYSVKAQQNNVCIRRVEKCNIHWKHQELTAWLRQKKDMLCLWFRDREWENGREERLCDVCEMLPFTYLLLDMPLYKL